MPVIGALDTDYILRAGGPQAGPFYAYPFGAQWPAAYVLTLEWTTATTVVYKMWWTYDGGNSWEELDSANRPSMTRPSTPAKEPASPACCEDATYIHVVVPNAKNTGGLNDTELKYYRFTKSTNTWSSLITTMDQDAATNNYTGDHSNFCCGVRADGDLIVAYQRQEGASYWKRSWIKVWNGSTWTSAVSVGEGDDGLTSTATYEAPTAPQSIVVDSSDRAFISIHTHVTAGSSPWNHAWAGVTVLDTDDTVSDAQLQINDLSTPVTQVEAEGSIGQGVFNSDTGEVAFPVIHCIQVTSPVSWGMRALYATASLAPTWSSSGDLISTSEIAADQYLGVNEHADGYKGNGAAVYDSAGLLMVIWGSASGRFGFSRRQSDGTWSDPGYLNYVPTYAIDDIPELWSLSVAKDSASLIVAAVGQASDSVGSGDWSFYQELSIPADPTSAATVTRIGVSF